MAVCGQCGAKVREGASFCGACGVGIAPNNTGSDLRASLALDLETLEHLRAKSRCLLRFRLENTGTVAFAAGKLSLRCLDAPLAELAFAQLAPSNDLELRCFWLPEQSGFVELQGRLEVRGLGDFSLEASFEPLPLRVAAEAPAVQIVNIDQSSARVVDNSKAQFGASAAEGGLVESARWRELLLQVTEQAEARPPVASADPRAAARVNFSVKTAAGLCRAQRWLAQGELSTVYEGELVGEPETETDAIVLKLVDQATDNDLMLHESSVLRALHTSENTAVKHFPVLREQFRTADGRVGNVLQKLDGLTLSEVLERCKARGMVGLPERHLVWLLRRCLAALGCAHEQGILHGNLDPSHILVRPRDHMVWIVDWCWAVVRPAETGQSFKVLNEVFSPPEVAQKGKPTPASELYALGKCMFYVLGGVPETKSLPELEPRLARFLKYLTVESQAGRPQDAWELYFQVDRIRQQIWGPHTFVPLEL